MANRFVGRIADNVQEKINKDLSVCRRIWYASKEKFNELLPSYADWGLTLSGGGHTNICEFHFTFPLKPNIVDNANGAGGREGGSRNGKSSTTLKKELSANFRRACVNSSNRRLLCHRTIGGLSVRPEERGITELLSQGPTDKSCVFWGWFYLGANAFHVSQAFSTRLGPGSDGHEIFNLLRHLAKEIQPLPE